MSKINVDTWEPESGTAATLMATGDTVTVPSGAELDIASGATLDVNGTIDITGATATGFPTGGFHQVVVKTASDSTYSPDTDVTKIIVEVQGAGGGTSNTTGANGSAGAGSGGYAMKSLDVTSSYVIDITIGAGGLNGTTAAAGSTTTVAYVSGGSSFTTITCTGGNPGPIGPGLLGGSGGTASDGDLNINGGKGMNYRNGSSDGMAGANSMFGQGGQQGTPDPATLPGSGYGSGASGAINGSGTGTVGQPGLVLIWEYK